MGEPKHGTGPIVLGETPGKKAYCQCGLSAKLPYCDGTHSRENTGITPIVIEITEGGTKAICQCYQSGNKPWCDGTHSRLNR
ncbi:MAG: CDGSH iron-sulfur domain-containing protein [Phycisphaerae bacterium]